jgi:two-component system, chemotaxis family, CheB/CheR fusion protein
VLLDIGIPSVNGFETAKRIRSEAWSRGTVLIGMSGHSNEEYRGLAGEAGFDSYVIKPMPLKEITGLIEEFSNVADHYTQRGGS